MTKVTFYKPDKTADEKLKFAVIAARYQDKWVFCRHKQRTTWEIPGGHRDPDEVIEETARRELAEETGAVDADIHTVAVYEPTVLRESRPRKGLHFSQDCAKLNSNSRF